MKNKKRSRAKARKNPAFFSFSNLGFSGWAIIFLSVAILTFLGSMVFNQSRAYKSKTAFSAVTLQLLNGCGAKGACEKLAEALLPGEEDISYDIIEKADAKVTGFDKTVIIDRRGGSSDDISEMALRIAGRMGIKKDEILQIGLADNLLDIDVTIIAGPDYMEYVDRLQGKKEEVL